MACLGVSGGKKLTNNIETLLLSKGKKSKERWYPVSLERYKSLVSKGCMAKMSDEIRRNIGYSLQYLEFLDLQIKELVMSGVIKTMVYKNYVITSVSVIESLLEQIIHFNNLQTTEYYEVQRDSIDSNEFKDVDGKYKKIRTQILIKLDEPKEIQMKFDDIIKKIKSKNKKNKFLQLEHDEILALDRFRKLRNKVHLSNVEKSKTNWHEFSESEYITVKFLLYSILSDKSLENEDNQNCISFLKLSAEEKKEIENFKKIKEKK
ncbi:hypothetical protein [Streptococcus gordonii]|uniref:hypothetical protein n=1 Tax=Streptococcus gordonii TaxID=1302 RepID=UPI002A38550D|nr:hypothetical protein [Streptococcus gordonii]